MKRTRIASIDAGANKVVTVMADMNGNGDLRILGVGEAASQGMEKDMITVFPDMTIKDVATLMIERGVYYCPVTEGEKLVGVITKKDIVRAIANSED